MKQLHTEIHVDAPPAVVWDVMNDLAAYPQWNPFVVSAAGTLAVGERLTVRLQPPGGRAATFRPVVTAVEPGRAFEWLGHLGVPGLFDGRHRYDLQPERGGTRFVQSEEFRGVLVPLMARSLDTGIRQGFEAMNRALARRAEAVVAGPA